MSSPIEVVNMSPADYRKRKVALITGKKKQKKTRMNPDDGIVPQVTLISFFLLLVSLCHILIAFLSLFSLVCNAS